MSDARGDSPLHNKAQRKKARRKERKQRERQAHRNLDDVTSQAIELALAAAREVTAAGAAPSAVPIDVALASISEAQFVRKRVNDALMVGEWLDDVRVAMWTAGDGGDAHTTSGASSGIELRIEREPLRR